VLVRPLGRNAFISLKLFLIFLLAGQLRTLGRESAHHYHHHHRAHCMECVMAAGQRFGSVLEGKASLRERSLVSAHANLSHE
jgi:hypothetical protein